MTYKSRNQEDSTTPTAPTRRGRGKSPDLIETIVTWTFKVVMFPLHIVSVVFQQFLTPGAAGSSFLGKCVFLFLVVLSSDSYWQIIFQGKPLFPWYENDWTGWGWLPSISFGFFELPSIELGLFANPMFWMCVGVGMIIQTFQSACLNGERFATVNNPRVIGLIAVGTWIFDIIMTFTTRFPWRYSEPGMIIGCLLFNIFTIGCAEWGRWGEKVLSGK